MTGLYLWMNSPENAAIIYYQISSEHLAVYHPCEELLSICMLLTTASPHTILLIKSFIRYF